MTVLEVKQRHQALRQPRRRARRLAQRCRRANCAPIIGPNGAGKTTFFNLISGFFPPTSGTIVFDGRDITRLAAHKRVATRHGAHFPDHRDLSRAHRVRECAHRRRSRGRLSPAAVDQPQPRRPASKRRVAEMLKLAGLQSKPDRLVGELAHGDQRAAEIAMALALRPHLLLLDEPTAGMGDQETYEITQLIRRLHRDSKLTIVLIEHDMRVVFHLADRITVLDQGSVLAEGTPQEIAANEAVQAAYLGKAA